MVRSRVMLGKRYFSQLRSRRQSLPFPSRVSSPYRIRACHTRTAGPDWPPCDPSRAASPLEIQRPGSLLQNTLDLDPFVATFFFRAGPPPLSKRRGKELRSAGVRSGWPSARVACVACKRSAPEDLWCVGALACAASAQSSLTWAERRTSYQWKPTTAGVGHGSRPKIVSEMMG